MNQGTGILHTWRLPDVGTCEDVGGIKGGGTIVHLVADRSVEWECRITGVEAGNAFAEGKVIQALGIRVVRQDSKAVRHALFDGGLERMVVRVDIRNIGLNGGRKRVGFESAATA